MQNLHGQSDYRPHARKNSFRLNTNLSMNFLGRFVTADAPWNITQWVDPFDPHPKTPTMPVILVVRKRTN